MEGAEFAFATAGEVESGEGDPALGPELRRMGCNTDLEGAKSGFPSCFSELVLKLSTDATCLTPAFLAAAGMIGRTEGKFKLLVSASEETLVVGSVWLGS